MNLDRTSSLYVISVNMDSDGQKTATVVLHIDIPSTFKRSAGKLGIVEGLAEAAAGKRRVSRTTRGHDHHVLGFHLASRAFVHAGLAAFLDVGLRLLTSISG